MYVAMAGAVASLSCTRELPVRQWVQFLICMLAVLIGAGLKVAIPRTRATLSVTFPLILLGILEFSPLQTACLAIACVVVQSRIGNVSPPRILFNVANVTTAAVLAWFAYARAAALLDHQFVLALVLAVAVYFLANTLPVALLLTVESQMASWTQWRRRYRWQLPLVKWVS